MVYARYATFASTIDPGHLDYLFTRFADRSGFVLDVRDNGGGFPAFTELSNGWLLRVSAHRLFTNEGLNVELGIPPDTAVDMNPAHAAAGKDTILETALAFIRGL